MRAEYPEDASNKVIGLTALYLIFVILGYILLPNAVLLFPLCGTPLIVLGLYYKVRRLRRMGRIVEEYRIKTRAHVEETIRLNETKNRGGEKRG